MAVSRVFMECVLEREWILTVCHPPPYNYSRHSDHHEPRSGIETQILGALIRAISSIPIREYRVKSMYE